MRRRAGVGLERFLLLILLSLVVIAVVRYVGYRQRFPRPIQVGDLILEGTDREVSSQRLQEAFNQPVILRYLDQEVELDPKEVGFRLFAERMLDAVWDQPSVQLEPADFLAVTLGSPSLPLAVLVAADYDPQALWQVLQDVANQYDLPAQPPRIIEAGLHFTPGESARKLDIEASLPDVVGTLLSPTGRQVNLIVGRGIEEPIQRDMDLLQAAIQRLLINFPDVAGIYVKGLSTGEELEENGGVAFAGMSLMKVAIAEEFFRLIDRAPTREETKLLTETMTLTGSYAPNLLLVEIGEGNASLGARQLTQSMQRIGLVNTFMASPYNTGGPPPQVVTPANSRKDVDTDPDPHMQTTPRDMGLLLEMIYQCAQGGGTLLTTYPDQITPEECQAILTIMRSNHIDSLIEHGSPEGIPIAHKHGWIEDTHADAGIVFSPGGDYLLVIFLHQRGWLQLERSAPLIADIAHVTYNYFNLDDQW